MGGQLEIDYGRVQIRHELDPDELCVGPYDFTVASDLAIFRQQQTEGAG